MKSYNEDFYNLFSEIADLMSLLSENPFKIRAYREAARRARCLVASGLVVPNIGGLSGAGDRSRRVNRTGVRHGEVHDRGAHLAHPQVGLSYCGEHYGLVTYDERAHGPD